MSNEKNIALKQAAESGAANAFFEAQPETDFYENRLFFEEGFFRGWDSQQVKIDMLLLLNSKFEGVAK